MQQKIVFKNKGLNCSGLFYRASELADKKNSEIIVYCKAGVRSQKAALALKQAGFTNVSNLTGGILAWAEKIDPSMPKY